jgi:hypothetical protein
MKQKVKEMITKFELYKKYIKGKKYPLEDANVYFLVKEIYGPKVSEWPKLKVYRKGHDAIQNIIDEIKLGGPREWLMEGILAVKKDPNNQGLYDVVLAAIEHASQPDLVQEFSRVSSSYGPLEEKIAVNS